MGGWGRHLGSELNEQASCPRTSAAGAPSARHCLRAVDGSRMLFLATCPGSLACSGSLLRTLNSSWPAEWLLPGLASGASDLPAEGQGQGCSGPSGGSPTLKGHQDGEAVSPDGKPPRGRIGSAASSLPVPSTRGWGEALCPRESSVAFSTLFRQMESTRALTATTK